MWGCNREGQLGCSTSNSASYLKGKRFAKVAVAKYHTIVLGADGEVFTWGHQLVTPKHIVIATNLKKFENSLLNFHHKEWLHVIAKAAGMVHSMVLTGDGALFYWVSSDPGLQCQQLHSLCGRPMVCISAGKHWPAAEKRIDGLPISTRLHGVKKATSVSLGEMHMLIVSSLYHPASPTNSVENPQKLQPNDGS